ncbi:tetratricopeptide repeat-containing serine/threonine-protein kinase [Myxococcota bacterium]
MACPDVRTLIGFAGQSLVASETATIRFHLESCHSCSELLLELTSLTHTQLCVDGDPPPRQPVALDGNLPTGTTVGRYVILHRIGAGGMGVVYAAYDPQLDRKIALKLLRPDRAEGSEAVRLLREAQSLARLAHPNVVSVFDAGRLATHVYIAMEFVEGMNLSQWLRMKSRSLREILAIYSQAGAGISAAHHANLVHRDVCVTDFGLAQPLGEVETINEAGEHGSLPASLTETGHIFGTPAYMAPEHRFGQPVDARSDQFSFCVSLHAALCGELPETVCKRENLKPRDALPQLRAQAPGRQRVPVSVQRALARGLIDDPAERFATMDDLLHALAIDSAGHRRRWAAGLLVLLLLVGVLTALFYSQRARGVLCTGSASRFASVWSDEQKSAIRAAFLATGSPSAHHTWQQVYQRLDSYGSMWVASHREACEATHLRGEQPSHIQDLRMLCLEQRREQVATLTRIFARAEAKTLERAVDAVQAIASVADCDDITALARRERLPLEPDHRKAVERLSEDLARIVALQHAGHFSEARSGAQGVVEAAHDVGYRPLESEALLALADLQYDDVDEEACVESIDDAVWAALAGGHDTVAVRALTTAVNLSRRQAKYDDAHRYADRADAILERLGGDPRLESDLSYARGTVLRAKGHFDEAVRYYDRALEIAQGVLDEDDLDLAGTWAGSGNPYADLGDFEEALRRYQHSLAIRERVLGSNHLWLTQSLKNIGHAFVGLGRYEEAVRVTERALAIEERAVGPDHPRLAITLNNLGIALLHMKRVDEALAHHRRAFEIRERALKPGHPHIGWVHLSLGLDFRELGRFEEARDHTQRGLTIMRAAFGNENPQAADGLTDLGILMLRQRQWAEALDHCSQAQGVYESLFGEETRKTVPALVCVGQAHLGRSQPGRALPLLERAWALQQKADAAPHSRGELLFALARAVSAMSDTEQARARARALGEQAITAYQTQGPYMSEEVAEIRGWLDSLRSG